MDTIKNKTKKAHIDELKNIVYQLGREICITNCCIDNPNELDSFKKLYDFAGLNSEWINKKHAENICDQL